MDSQDLQVFLEQRLHFFLRLVVRIPRLLVLFFGFQTHSRLIKSVCMRTQFLVRFREDNYLHEFQGCACVRLTLL